MKVFRLFVFFGVQSVDTVCRCTTSYLFGNASLFVLDGTEVAKDSKTQKQISTLKTAPESGDNLSLVQSSDEEDIPLLENQLVNMKPI
jgi:hypothetical protein